MIEALEKTAAVRSGDSRSRLAIESQNEKMRLAAAYDAELSLLTAATKLKVYCHAMIDSALSFPPVYAGGDGRLPPNINIRTFSTRRITCKYSTTCAKGAYHYHGAIHVNRYG